MLYDHLGRPVKTTQLTKEVADASVAGVRTVWHDSVANNLTPTTLASILLKVDQGDIIEYLTLAEEMEERDMHYSSVLGTRKLAVTGLDVMVESVSDDSKDVEIADAVRELVKKNTFDSMLPAPMDAIGKSYSVTEIMWDRSGNRWTPAEYKWRDPRFFQFDLTTKDELRMRDDEDLVNGVPLAPFKFIVHRPQIKMGVTIRCGIARMVCVGYMLKGYTLKDWWAFMEVFGMPWRVGKYPPKASKEQKDALLAAVRQMGADAACTIPEDMMIDIIESSKTSGGDKLFSGSADWVDKQISKAVLGQTASTEGTPGRLGNEELQSEVRDDIKKSDAKQLSATISRDLIKPFVDLNFGPQEEYPTFRLVIEEKKDLKLLSEALGPFIDRGLRVQSSLILDEFGYPEAEDGAEILQPIRSAGQPQTAPAEPEGDVDEVTLQREQKAALVEICRRIKRGDQISSEERQLFIASMALAANKSGSDSDEIDRLVTNELDDWRQVMDPVLQPIIDHAESSDSFVAFLEGLEAALANIDTKKFQERLATMTLIARGRGDATDEV
jgi:phage gp29-like protein